MRTHLHATDQRTASLPLGAETAASSNVAPVKMLCVHHTIRIFNKRYRWPWSDAP